MKTVKLIILFLPILLFTSNPVNAQSNKKLSEEQKQELIENIKEYFSELNLSDQQKEDFKAISEKYAIELKELKNSNESRLSKYKKLKAIQESKNKEMKGILNDEQYKVYLKKQEEIRQKAKEKRKG